MARHAYLPTLLTIATGSIFVSYVIQEIAEVLSITFRHHQHRSMNKLSESPKERMKQ